VSDLPLTGVGWSLAELEAVVVVVDVEVDVGVYE
jgi:hypothetical protein